ncbi:MAG: hypothetical protein HXS47_08385 [Theionarchaea archaeon]|nr:hypothetical protein [Theionarchaea archaeon]
MKRYVLLAFFLFLLVPSTGGPGSKTIYEVTPHIGNETVSVTQTYYLTEEGLTRFDALTLSLSYADLRIFDEQGDLDFEVGENIIIGKHLYRTLTVQFRTSLTGPYTFTISYWYPTHATGKPLTGKYVYNIVNLTDSTQFILSVPLTDIRATSRSSPQPSVEYREDATVFSYQYSEDTRITLAYVPEEEIDYGDVQTDRYPFEDYFFEITYPRKAALFREDIEFFIEYMFPVYLQETGIPLRYETIEIALDREEDTWAAAEYLGGGKMRVLINNTASYPSTFLAHELTHSHIGDFPRYLEEGMANYFEGRVSRIFTPPLPNSYIPNRESYFQTFERQFNTTVNITEDTYGLGLTDYQEALIYAKYSKGTYCVYEIASVCGYETVQHMLSILSEQSDCSLNYVIAHLAEGDQIYEILKKYGFRVVPPYMYPTQELLEETQDDSWWGYVLCALAGYQSRITEGEPEDIPALESEIEDTKLKAAQTLWVMNGLFMVVTAVGVWVCSKKIYRAVKKNPQNAYYFYLIPMFIALFIFGYFLYEFLFHGHKARWICENVLLLWGMGILSGSVIALLSAYALFRRTTLYVPEVIWAVLFFVTVSSTAYFSVMKSILWGVGYGVSAGVLFIIRRNYYGQSAKNIQEKKKKNK